MTLNFQKNLKQALNNIGQHTCQEFILHDKEEERTHLTSDSIIESYGKIKWRIVDIINNKYNTILKDKFDLYNWLNHNKDDELAYFLNEVGSNALSHSQFKVPSKFHLWLGEKGFVIGIEQKGKGFNAILVDENNVKINEGAAFDFFRNCTNEIFFDNSQETQIIYMEMLFVERFM